MSSPIVGPIPPYSNPPIEPQFFQPSRFVISNISVGVTTTVTTSVNHNYVIGQQVRLLIPQLFGSQQLNNVTGFVISIPSATQVVLNIDSSYSNSFIPNPFTATITNATQANPCVLTANNSFLLGNSVVISGILGMTQLNGNQFQILSCTPTTINLNVDSTFFTSYVSGGVANLVTNNTTVAQIIATGDVNSGQTNSDGRTQNITYVPGSFINISPL
jgi:hypothetical protein